MGGGRGKAVPHSADQPELADVLDRLHKALR
jgi:hypothetical protein